MKKNIVGLFAILVQTTIFGVSYEWNIPGSGTWSTAGNWNPSGPPNATNDQATFADAVSGGQTVTVSSGPFDVDQLVFNNTNGDSYLISGSGASGTIDITLGGSTPQISVLGTNTPNHTISAPLEVQDSSNDFTITNAGSGTLFLSSAISPSGGSGFRDFNTNGPGIIELSGINSFIIGNGGASRVRIGVVAGTLRLNTTGGLAIPSLAGTSQVDIENGSTLQLLQADQIGTSNDVVVQEDATFDLNNNNQTIRDLFFSAVAGTQTVSTGTGTLRTESIDGSISGVLDQITGSVSLYNGVPIIDIQVPMSIENLNCERPNCNITVSGNFGLTPLTISGVLSSTTTTNYNITGQFNPTNDIVNLTGSSANTYSGTFNPEDITLNLNKVGVTAITGDLTIDVGISSTIVNVLQAGQFGGSSASGTVSMRDANVTFDISATASGETIGALDYRAGTLTQGGMTLSLATTGTNALIMRNVTISDPISIISTSGGGVSFADNNNGTAIISGAFDLGTIVRDFDIDNGSASTDMRITSVISGIGGGINLTGAGTLELMGSASNTFTGDVTAGAGTLILDNSSGTIIPGELVISGGTVTTPSTSQTLGSLNFQSGTLTQSGNALNLDSTGTNALTMRGVTISDGINLTGASGGGVFYDSNTGSSTTATLSGGVDLGSVVRAFNIESGASTTDMEISGVVSGTGGIAKSGTGLLELNGSASNTYSGTTSVSAGTLALNMSSGDAFASTTVSVTGGTLRLDGSDQIPDATSVSITGATFELTGTITDTISGLTLDGATLLKQDTAGGTLTFTSSTLSNSNTFTASSASGVLELSGPLIGTGSVDITGSGVTRFAGSNDNTYSGTITPTSGDLHLSKGSTNLGSSGPIMLTSATEIRMLSNANQIITSDTLTIGNAGANLDLNSLNTSLGALVFNAGSITHGASETLTLTTTATNALTMRDTTISGPVSLTGASGGGILFDNTNGGTATLSDLDLGAVQRTFDIQQGGATPDLDVTGVLAGTSGFIKSGLGTLQLNPTTPPNTYTGTIDVQQGELLVDGNGTSGTIRGDVQITGGMVTLGSSDNFVSTSNVTLSSGMFSMAGFDETVNSFTFQAGSFVQNMGELSLGSTGTALTMRNTSINGQINLTGASGGDVVFDNTNNGTATIAAIDLGTENRTFNIANGTATNDMILNGGSSTGGGINKAGPGNLRLNGMHTYTGGTTTVSAGQLQIEGTYSSTALNVSPGATLLGSGTITSDCMINGTMAPGSSIGTTFVVGSATFISTSTFEVEHDLTTTDLLDVSGAPGTVTIDPGATLSVITTPAVYPQSSMYTIISTTGGITGNFTNITGTGAAFTYSAAVSGNNLILTVIREPLDVIVVGGNASKVAKCLNELTLEQDSDLQNIIVTLECECAAPEIRSLLTQMQPSQLKGFAISQENNSFKIKNAINQRTREIYRKGCTPEPLQKGKISMWGDVFGDFYQQQKIDSEVAFSSNTAGALAGVDYQGVENYLIGFSGSYTYSDMKWKENRGTGDINSVYGTLYGTYFGDSYFINGALLGAFNHYNEARYIKVSFLNRKAQGNFDGGEVMTHLDGAYILKRWEFEFQPFASLDFVYLYQQSFKETGAAGINLDVDSSDYGMFRSELGINVSRCINKAKAQFLIDGKLSWIREERFFGANYEAKFKGTDCTFKVKGMNPDRSLFSPGIRGTYITDNGNKLVSLGYEAEVGGHSLDQNVSLQGVYKF